MGRRLDAVEVEGRLEHRLDGGDDDGEVRRLAPGHDGVDRELLERGLAPERRHRAEAPVGRRLAEHRAHALLGRRNDGQPVAPLALAERGEERLWAVIDLNEAGRLCHRCLSRLVSCSTAWRARRPIASGRSPPSGDRKSTRLNSSHGYISYAV